MTTSYYFTEDTCTHCGRSTPRLRIGVSAIGWCFSVHVYPDESINTLEDWKQKLQTPGCTIEDEYGKRLTPDQMLARITERGRETAPDLNDPNLAGAVLGPNNLLIPRVDGRHVLGHGSGTWYYTEGYYD